jgi:hypothetical protein
MILPGLDGINHINIYSKGQTELGRWLSNFTFHPIKIDDIVFKSIETYWYYLLTNDSKILNTFGYKSKELGKQIMKDKNLPSYFDFNSVKKEEFELKIKNALDTKLKSNKDRLISFGRETLPFAHYYVYGGRKFNAGHDWIIQHLEKRRQFLRETNYARCTELP